MLEEHNLPVIVAHTEKDHIHRLSCSIWWTNVFLMFTFTKTFNAFIFSELCSLLEINSSLLPKLEPHKERLRQFYNWL